MNNIHKTSGFRIKTRVRKTHMHSEFLKTSTAITSICTSGCTKQKIFWCVPLPRNLNYKIHFWAKTWNFSSTFQSNLEIWENAINRNKNNSRFLFFSQQLTIFLVLHFVPGAVTTSVVQLLLSPKKRTCDLHGPKNNNNNNINLAAELLQSGYHRTQRIRNSTAEICLSYFSTNQAIPSVTYYNMNNQTWQMEHKYTKTTMLKLTVKHLLLFNITTWHATLGIQTVGTNWQLDSNLKKHPLKKVVSACCCPSSWTQLWTWEQCLFFFSNCWHWNDMWCFDSEPQIGNSQGDITKEPMHQGVFGRQSFVRIVI